LDAEFFCRENNSSDHEPHRPNENKEKNVLEFIFVPGIFAYDEEFAKLNLLGKIQIEKFEWPMFFLYQLLDN
jgi:hypothetical protein